LVFMITILFSGCGAITPTYVNTNLTSIYATISYDDENLTEMGVDSIEEIEMIKDDIESKSALYIDQLTLKYRNIINELYDDGLITSNDKIIYRNHLDFYCGWDNESYIIEMRFHSTTASRYFIRYGGEIEENQIENSLFTTKVTEEYTSLFTELPNNMITSLVSDYFNDSLSTIITNEFGQEAEEIFSGTTVSFMFLSSNRRIHSNGQTFDMTEGSLHYFDESEENVFIFYRIEANRYVWYILALTLTMIFLAGSLIYIYFKKDDGKNVKEISKKE
ncbi:MAG: hypothetical protein PHS54_04515, partial [Clostridia bacterium]|nr:hypothetical protein [Clostridia bacterium]